jgi:hypothetical protein
MASKKRLLAEAQQKNLWISFSHDDQVAAGKLSKEAGKSPQLQETIAIIDRQ